jgi:tetraacyldisaccharide 4'-kinase
VLTPGHRPTWWLLWAAIPYNIAVRLRAHAYNQGWLRRRRLPVPVLSIGNLTVGGTGKTPLVIDIATWLLTEGKRVAVLSRGYRRVSRAPMVIVSDGARIHVSPQEAGDEPYLIAERCPQAVVAVGADRYQLGRWVLNQFPVDCLLLDDGFQHLGLQRDVDLLLLDATDYYGLDQVVPAGRLREPLEASRRATAVIFTKADTQSDIDQVVRRLRSVLNPLPMTAQVVFRTEALRSVLLTARQSDGPDGQWYKGKTALLVSGIAHAASFKNMVDQLGLTILEEVVNADHHLYTNEDIVTLRRRAAERKAELVITTEKDAVKLRPFLTPADTGWWAVRLRTEWTAGSAALRQMILSKLSRTSEAPDA